ncbi:nucleotide exchange factor GrpE [Candidatus Woesearchaeota archaeon]|nr:nucleotide exchange factor GrpE [Candidatus Woesearchaeota archaeon]
MEKNKKHPEKKPKEKKPKEKKPTDKERIGELTDSIQRLQAEFENYKKRVDKEKEQFVKYAKAEVIEKILSVIDTFEIALKANKQETEFSRGMDMVYSQLFSALEKEGLRPIESLGKKFDHNYHEVMLKQESDKEEDTILEELQKGYMINNKILRHTKVKISQGKKRR